MNRSVLSLVLESFVWGGAAAGIIAAKVMSEVKFYRISPSILFGRVESIFVFLVFAEDVCFLFFQGAEEAMSACVSGGGTVLGCLSAWDGGGGANWMMTPGGSNSVVMLKACLESGGTSPSTATSCVIAWVTTGNGWWLGLLIITLMLFIARLAAIYVGWKRPKAAVVAKLTQNGWVLGGDAGNIGKGEQAWNLMVSPTPPASRAGSSIGDMLGIHR